MLRPDFNAALKTAMLAKDEKTVGTLRLVLAKLKDCDIAARPKGITDGISDDEILRMMQAMVKQRRESIVMFEKGNRPDLVQQENDEIAIIERFLPKQMGADETKAAVEAAIATVGAKEVKDMGKVIGELRKTYAGQMDFALAGGLIKTALGG